MPGCFAKMSGSFVAQHAVRGGILGSTWPTAPSAAAESTTGHRQGS